MDMELVMRQVQVHIQARQAEISKGHSEWLEFPPGGLRQTHLAMVVVIEEKMARLEDKLNGLIGYIDENRKPESTNSYSFTVAVVEATRLVSVTEAHTTSVGSPVTVNG